eukprot:EG_transcript_8419
MGSIFPPPGVPPACGQLYILDNHVQNAARRLLPFVEDLEADLLDALARMLSRVNPFVHSGCSTAFEIILPVCHIKQKKSSTPWKLPPVILASPSLGSVKSPSQAPVTFKCFKAGGVPPTQRENWASGLGL